jgi:putative ABC transport system substrate-binding protein
MKRRETVLALLALGAVPLISFAQQQGKVWRVGYVDFGSRQSTVDAGRYDALIQGLRENGYVEGRNLVLEARFAEGDKDRAAGFAAELVRQNVDLILALGSGATRAVKQATATIPIVVISSPDPVSEGFAASLARPGGNITGMSNGTDDTAPKLVELLTIAIPKLNRITLLTNPANGAHASLILRYRATAEKIGRQVLPVSARTEGEIDSGFAKIAREGTDAVIILADAFLFQRRAQIAALALKHRLPSIYAFAGYAEVGGLMSYGADNNDNFRRAGIFVDKILKGAKPGDMPFEQPTRYYFIINRKTAHALGVKLTDRLLLLADRVIE